MSPLNSCRFTAQIASDVREGRSYATRTVQARQRGKAIFTTTLSFVRVDSGGKKMVEHAAAMPDVPPPKDNEEDLRFPQGVAGPFQSQRIDILNSALPRFVYKGETSDSNLELR